MRQSERAFRFPILIGAIFAFIGIILSFLLACKHSGVCVSSMGCEIGGTDGCAELGESRYSRFYIPFVDGGVAIAWLGLFYYSLIFFLFFRLRKATKEKRALGLLMAMAAFGFVFDLLLAYRNFFILETPCLLCAYTYLCQLGILLSIGWIYLAPVRDSQEKSKSIGFFAALWQGFQATYHSFIGASIVTLGLSLIILFSHGNERSHHSNAKTYANPLLPYDKVSSVLREFRALKTIKIPEKGLKSYEGNSQGFYIIIHEWLDFNCPHCRHGAQLVKKALQRWPGRIRVYYRQFPLDGNCNPHIQHKQSNAASCKAAMASLCIAGRSYFSGFVHQLFDFQSSQTRISYQSLRELVESLGGRWSPIQACMSAHSTKQELRKDISAAKVIEISATPAFVIQSRPLPSGVPDEAWLFRVLDALVLEKEGEAAREDYQNRHQ